MCLTPSFFVLGGTRTHNNRQSIQIESNDSICISLATLPIGIPGHMIHARYSLYMSSVEMLQEGVEPTLHWA